MSLPVDAAERNEINIWTYQMNYFPKAFLAEVQVAIVGNRQHNPGQPMHWSREKSKDHMNKAARHQWDYGCGIKKDVDGTWHLAKAIWRLKAQLQIDIEADEAEAYTAAIDKAVLAARERGAGNYGNQDQAVAQGPAAPRHGYSQRQADFGEEPTNGCTLPKRGYP